MKNTEWEKYITIRSYGRFTITTCSTRTVHRKDESIRM